MIWLTCTILVHGLMIQKSQAQSWTAQDATKIAIAQHHLDDHLEHAKDEVDAQIDDQLQYTNPQLALSYQHIFGGDAVSMLQLGVGISHTFDVVDWRGAIRQSTPHTKAALEAQKRTREISITHQVNMAFYKVIYLQRQRDALQNWITQLKRGQALVAARKKQGDLSALALARFTQALQIAQAKQAIKVNALTSAWANLRALAPFKTRPTLRGKLSPKVSSQRPIQQPPWIRSIQHKTLAIDAQVQAWGSPIWRNWTVQATYFHVAMQGQHGPGFGLSLNIPMTIRNTNQPKKDKLLAKRAHLTGELRLAKTLNERAQQAARTRLASSLKTIASLSTKTQTIDIIKVAEAAYKAGELPLSELLSAYQNQTELQMLKLDMQWQARKALIDLNKLQGKKEPQ